MYISLHYQKKIIYKNKKMKKNKIIYWATTGIIALLMAFSAYSYLSKPEIVAAFKHLGFPDYLRVELAVAKISGALILIIPAIPVKIKEWAYAGFGIVFISASIAHASNGDAAAMIITPMVFFAILIVSNIYLHKQKQLTVINSEKELITTVA
jgi:DoxX-like family